MAEDNEIPFDTADVTAIQDNDPALASESDIVSFVQGRFKRAEDVRQQDEQRWLKAYRNYRGLYGPDVQFTETEKSRVFVKVTKTKTLFKDERNYIHLIRVDFKFNVSVTSPWATRLDFPSGTP